MTSDANRGALPVSPATSSPSEPRLFGQALPNRARSGRSRLRDNIIIITIACPPSPSVRKHTSHITSIQITRLARNQEHFYRDSLFCQFLFFLSPLLCVRLYFPLLFSLCILYILTVLVPSDLGLVFYPVSCILHPVSCISNHLSCVLFPVSWLGLVSCILYLISSPLYYSSRR